MSRLKHVRSKNSSLCPGRCRFKAFGLAFCGTSKHIGDPHNGNFLRLIELLTNIWFDSPFTCQKWERCKTLAREGLLIIFQKMSKMSSFKFVHKRWWILPLILPSLQNTLELFVMQRQMQLIPNKPVLVRYFKFADRVYTIVEWFLHFVDCNKKT